VSVVYGTTAKRGRRGDSKLSNRSVTFESNRIGTSDSNLNKISKLRRSLSYGVPQGFVLGPLLFIMYSTPQLVTLALSLVNISPSLTKSQHFLNPAILLFVHFVVSVLISIKKQPVPSPHPLSILNLTTATLFIIIFELPITQTPTESGLSCPHCFQYSKNLSHHSCPRFSSLA